MSSLGLALDLLIAALLMVTIVYCWVLNRRIRIIQDSKSELAQLLKHFDESTQRASESIIALQTASKKIGENIQFRIDKANYLLDDLSFMIEKGHTLANRIEAGFAVDRARARAGHEPEEKRENAPLVPVLEKPEEKPLSTREKTVATLEAVLERVVSRGQKPAAANDIGLERPVRPPQPPAPSPRSKAEQELLDMIKAGIKG